MYVVQNLEEGSEVELAVQEVETFLDPIAKPQEDYLVPDQQEINGPVVLDPILGYAEKSASHRNHQTVVESVLLSLMIRQRLCLKSDGQQKATIHVDHDEGVGQAEVPKLRAEISQNST